MDNQFPKFLDDKPQEYNFIYSKEQYTTFEINKKIQTLNYPHDKEVIKRQIDAIDTEIDKIVYGLYGLSDEEIKVVEGE